MATRIAVTDQFIQKLVQTKSVRARFSQFDSANQTLKSLPTGCCGRDAGAAARRSQIINSLRNFVMKLNPADAGELKRLLGLTADTKLVVTTGFGTRATKKEI